MLGEKLKRLREEKTLSQTKLSKILDIPQTTYSNYETNRNQPDYAILKRIAQYFNVSIDYLLDYQNVDINNKIEYKENIPVPIYGYVGRGYNMFSEENIVGYANIDEETNKKGNHFYLYAKGSSMENVGIYDGSLILVRKTNVINDNEIAIIQINGDEATCRRVKYDDEHVILIAENKDVLPLVVSKKRFSKNGDCFFLGRVISSRNSFE